MQAHPRPASQARTAGRDVVARQRQREIGDDEAGLVAAIVALAVEGEAVEGLAADQRAPCASVSWISPPAPFAEVVRGSA